MMQCNYKVDGWLGMCVGTKLWIDFKSKQVMIQVQENLLKSYEGEEKTLTR